MNSLQQHNCDAWIEMFTRLEAEGVPSLERMRQIASGEVRFSDPFNDLVGLPALHALLEHTRRQIRDVRFRVIDKFATGQRVYLKWEMNGTVRLLGFWRVQGMSELVFDDGGKLTLH